MSLTGLAVRKSTTVLVLILFIFIAGLHSYFTLPREAAPDVKIPYMIVIGDKEVDSGLPSVRRKGRGDLGAMSREDLLEKLESEIKSKEIVN